MEVLKGIDCEIREGELVAIMGSTGSGKSTLLNVLGLLDDADHGSYKLDGQTMDGLTERMAARYRSQFLGFVFQSFNLIPTLTAVENVALPIQFSKNKQFNPTRRAKELLELFGLGDRFTHRPTQLSGGQQQRVAIARALANNPPLLLGDEPTGNLDTKSSDIVMDALREVQSSMNTTVVLVTHDMDIASQVDRLITLVDGKIAQDDPRSTAQRHAAAELREKRETGELSAVKE